ncbi:MAG: GIY-YIG nuclease family protein [Candidatus Fonsibacter sp.]
MLTRYGIVYLITNKVNGKIYLGQTTKSLSERWRQHCISDNCKKLHNAIKKYGKDSFDVSEIYTSFSKEDLDNKEIYWISYFNTVDGKFGYNLKSGGSRGVNSQEVRIKIGLSLKQKYKDESYKNRVCKHLKNPSSEVREKMKLAKIGTTISEDHKNKISLTLKNKKKTKKHAENISKAKTGLKYNWKNKFDWNNHPEKKKAWIEAKRKYKTKEESNFAYNLTKKNKRSLLKEEFNKKGKLVGIKCLTTNKEYKTYSSAAKELKINICVLREHIIGLYSQVGGYKFEAIFNTLKSEGDGNG